MIFFFAPSSIGWEERTGYCSTNASPNSFIRDNTFWRFPSLLRSAAISCQGRRGADGGSIGRKYPMLVGQTSAKVRLFSVNQFPLPWRECIIPRPIVGVMAIFQQLLSGPGGPWDHLALVMVRDTFFSSSMDLAKRSAASLIRRWAVTRNSSASRRTCSELGVPDDGTALQSARFRHDNPQSGTRFVNCPQFSGGACTVHFGAACVDGGLRGLYQRRQFCAVGF